MKIVSLKILPLALVISSVLTPSLVLACATKSGKICTNSAAAQKIDPKVKEGKRLAPAGNIGATTVAGGVKKLGVKKSSSRVGLPTSYTLSDTYVYQLHGHTLSPFDETKLVSDSTLVQGGQHGTLSDKALAMGYTRVLAPIVTYNAPNHFNVEYQYYLTRNGQTVPLTDNQVDALRRGNHILPNGQLKPESQAHGFSAVRKVDYPVPTPNQVIAPPITQPMPTAQLKEPNQIQYKYYLTRNGQTVPLNDRQVQALRRDNFILPNGQLKPESQAHGFSAVGNYPVPTPNQVIAPPITQPMPTTALKAPGYAAPGLQPTQTNQIIAPPITQPMPTTALKAPGYAAPGLQPSPTNQIIAPPIPTTAPNQIQYRYYLTRNGKTVPLTDNQVDALRRGNYILPNGQLKPESQAHGFSAVGNYPVPTPNQVIAPPITQPMPTAALKAPGYAVPDKAPTPNQVIAPPITQPMPTTVMTAPGYAVPDKVPTPNQNIAPPITQPMPTTAMTAPGYAVPDKAPTPNQNIAPPITQPMPTTVMTAPGYKVPDKAPTPNQVIAPPITQPVQTTVLTSTSPVQSSVLPTSNQMKNYCVNSDEDEEVYRSVNNIYQPTDEDQVSTDKSFKFIVRGFKEPDCICYSLTDCRYVLTNAQKK